MGSNFNFKNFGHELQPGGGGSGSGSGGWQPGNFPLGRQSSVYALTFDEFQTTVGGSGKDFGSMNMDELLKSIWSAEENQNIGSTSRGGGVGGTEGGGYLQKQGSLTLPRTLSQKTVDEVWKDMLKEKDPNGGYVDFGVPLREPTLGEVTLEEFLVRAGIVREEPQLAEKPSDVGIFSDFSRPVINSELGFGYQPQNTNQIGIQSAILPLNVNGVMSAAHQPKQQQQQPQILPKNPVLGYGAQMGITNNQLGSPRIRGGIAGISDLNSSMVQNSALGGMVGLGGNDVTVAAGSPGISSNGLAKSNGDISSVSQVPYVLSSGLRGRKSAVLEKVVERRQRRMIKNRESAARSRARKQAYTTELEDEVAKLKEENEELRKKQEEMAKMQKNQVVEIINQRNGAKRRCLRRTQTVIF